MRRIFVLCTILFASFNSINSVASTFDLLDPDYDVNKITVFNFQQTRRTYVTYIKDEAQNIFVIKQSKLYDSIARQGPLSAVRETLAAYIAESNGIPANRVRMLLVGYAIPGKLYLERLATLHTFVPGSCLNSKALYIRQLWKENEPEKQVGLTLRVIHDMSLHPDLSLIVALDTFVGNSDRGNNNFYYDEKADRFWAFDFGSTFVKNLAEIARQFVESLLQDESLKLKPQELCGLILYRDTLKKLNEKHSPSELHLKLDEFLLQAGIIPGSSLYNDEVAGMIQSYKEAIFNSSISSQKLVRLLSRFIKRQGGKELDRIWCN